MHPHEILTICPGLSVSSSGVQWTDSLGRVHDLARADRLSVGEAALRLKRSTKSVLRKIRRAELYPVVQHSARDIEVYVVALDDYLARKTRGVVCAGGAVRAGGGAAGVVHGHGGGGGGVADGAR